MQHDSGEAVRLMLDLWQNQFTAMMRDERYVDGMLDMLQKMQEAALRPTGAWPTPAPGSFDVPSTVAQSAAASPDAEPGQSGLLARRLALCEQRLSELESLVAELRR